MNERIRELVGQAKFMAEETINKQISANAELNAFAEKFAELIVKECCNIAHVHSEGSELHDEGTLYYYMEDIAVKIAEHFGVEE